MSRLSFGSPTGIGFAAAGTEPRVQTTGLNPAGFAVLNRVGNRSRVQTKSPSLTAEFEGVSGGFATFKTDTNDVISMPIANVITRQAWTGTFSIVRPKYGYPSAFKEV